MRSSQHSGRNPIDSVLSAAARRRTLTIALERTATAIALVFVGAILTLLLGAQILAWYWLAILAGVGAALVIVRVRSRPIQRYRLAQILDRRLKLSDSLSTAWFLLSHSRRDDPFARFQIERAEQIAGSVKPAAAFPFSGSRSWAVAGALAAVAFGLFAVRYLVTRSLDFQPALVAIHIGPVLEALEKPSSVLAPQALPPQPLGVSQAAPSNPQEGRTEAAKPREPKPGNAAQDAASQATSQDREPQPDSRERSAGQASQAAQSHREREPDSHDRASQPSPQATEQASREQSSSGLLDKMKDALSSLMAKMRPNGSSQQPAPRGDRSAEEQKSSPQAALGKEQHGNQQNARSDRAAQEQSTQGQAQGQTTEKAQSSQARNASQSSEHKGSDSQSGVGRQDGDKNIKEAEQLRAMGKLAEIIGKRSATLTGDMTVETPSGKQELKTEYSQRIGRHSDLGGEINRDEIPLIYQRYIRDYMDEVRKQQQGALPP